MSAALRERLVALVDNYAKTAADHAVDQSHDAHVTKLLARQALLAYIETVDLVPRGHQPVTLGV